jgi:hypothetical protein
MGVPRDALGLLIRNRRKAQANGANLGDFGGLTAGWAGGGCAMVGGWGGTGWNTFARFRIARMRVWARSRADHWMGLTESQGRDGLAGVAWSSRAASMVTGRLRVLR